MRIRAEFHAPSMKHPLVRLSSLGMCVALIAGALIALPASASNLDDKKAKASQLQREIDANGEQISMLAERYDGARLRHDAAQRKIAGVEAQLDRARAHTDRIGELAARRAVELYVGAGAQSPIGWTDLADLSEAGSRSAYAAATADRDHRLLDGLRSSREDLTVVEHALESARNKAQRELDELEAGRQEIEAANARQQDLLGQVNGEIATLIAQERARQEAAEKARSDERLRQLQLAAAAAAAASAAPTPTTDTSNTSETTDTSNSSDAGNTGGSQVPVPDAPAPSAGAAAAVAYAKAQLGKPYRYAGTGPDEFDCSGLTMMAWAQGGVSMPHYSAAQGAMFPRVPNDQLQPGDLVIYYPDEHHVAIYAGDGMTIAATQTGDFIKLQPVFRSSFNYAVRPG